MVNLSLGPEALAKRAGDCLPGCGECCYFVFPSYDELVKAEKVAASPLPQLPGTGFFSADMNMKKLLIRYGEAGDELGPVCPLLYAADRNYQPFKVRKISIKKEILDVLDESNSSAHHQEKTVVTVIVEGAPDYTLLCGVHAKIQTGELRGERFDRCREWKYESDREKQENDTCLFGIAKLSRRLFLGK